MDDDGDDVNGSGLIDGVMIVWMMMMVWMGDIGWCDGVDG